MLSRRAVRADAEAIVRIYNQGIAERIATFETQPRTVADIEPWFSGRYPAVVVEDAGKVVAFAATFAYSQRECYAGVAEFSVYVDPAARRRGSGRLAVESLMGEAISAGFWKVTGKIFAENQASREMVRKLGFREVGVHQKHSRLDGKWNDIVVVERLLVSE
jgi:L-amino acid N-acyltransferase YncA